MKSVSVVSLAFVATLLALGPLIAFAQDHRVLSAKPASAESMANEHRVALVIGNSAYAVGPLKNPVNDAQDIASKLRKLGFDVVERSNLKTSQIGRTLREFRAKLSAGAVALVFYAGHGLQIKGENYLPTIDADIEGEEDVSNQSLSTRQLLEMLEESKTRLNLVFLDACRNNPFSRKFRAAGGGLARVSAPSGTLISYATRPGSVASDGDGRNGLYTTQLLQVMDIPNQPIEQALKRVVSTVKSASKGQQEPWMEGSIEGDFYFLQQAEAAAAPVLDMRLQQEAIDRAILDALRRANDQSAREKSEQQAAAIRDAVRLANEQAARERAELQAAKERAEIQAARERAELQAAKERAELQAARERAELQATKEKAELQAAAVQDAVRRANEQAAKEKAEAIRQAGEQAARERAELQASMEKLIRQALVEQNARIDAERRANQATQAVPPSVPTTLPVKPTAQKPQQLAMLQPTPVTPSADSTTIEGAVYRSTSVGKTQKMIVTTAATGTEPGLHEVSWGNGSPQEFDSRTSFVLGSSNEGGVLFAPRWNGKLDDIDIDVDGGIGNCAAKSTCKVSLRRVGEEKLTVPAGSFDAIKLDGWIRVSGGILANGTVRLWYSKSEGRLLKQEVNARNPSRIVYAEILELESLSAVRKRFDGIPVMLATEPGKPDAGTISALNFENVTAGDEWEYNATDHLFGNKRRLVRRVKAVAAGSGVLEEFLVDGKTTGNWVADGRPALVGVSSDIEPLFVPYWKPGELKEITVSNWGGAGTVVAQGRIVGQEKITVPAGSFDTTKIEVNLRFSTGNAAIAGSGEIQIWYSQRDHRIIRQIGQSRGMNLFRFNDTVELAAIRTAAR